MCNSQARIPPSYQLSEQICNTQSQSRGQRSPHLNVSEPERTQPLTSCCRSMSSQPQIRQQLGCAGQDHNRSLMERMQSMGILTSGVEEKTSLYIERVGAVEER